MAQGVPAEDGFRGGIMRGGSIRRSRWVAEGVRVSRASQRVAEPLIARRRGETVVFLK